MDALFAPPSPLLFGDEDLMSYQQAQGLGVGLLQPLNSAAKPLDSYLGAHPDNDIVGFGDDTYERLLPSLQAASDLDSQPDATDFFSAGKRKGFTSDQNGAAGAGEGLAQASSNKLARLQNFDEDDDIVVTSGSNGAGLLFPGYAATSSTTAAAASSLAWPIHGVSNQHAAVLQHPAVQSQAPGPSLNRVTRSVSSQHAQATSRALSTISEESEGRSSIAIDGVVSRAGGSSPGSAGAVGTAAAGGMAPGYLLPDMPGLAPAGSRPSQMLQHVQEDTGLDDDVGDGDDDDDDEEVGGEDECGGGDQGMWDGEGEGDDAFAPAHLGADEELLVVLPRPLVASLGKKGRLPFPVAYPRGRLVTGCAYSVGVYGVLNGQRGSRIAAFDALRARRIFYKKVKYTQRHSLANGRQRIKGRFVKDDTPGAAPPKATKGR